VLLDVVLSLMSRPPGPLPSSALRHVCESVWRASCEDLTLAGLQVGTYRWGGGREEGVTAAGEASVPVMDAHDQWWCSLMSRRDTEPLCPACLPAGPAACGHCGSWPQRVWAGWWRGDG
jgi:hypothetical protein